MEEVKAVDFAEYSSDMLFGMADVATRAGMHHLASEIRGTAFAALIKAEELKAQALGEEFKLASGFL